MACLQREADLKQSIAHIALVVRDYDEAIDFYLNKLRFELVEDTYQPEQDKRWVVVRPQGDGTTSLLLARASTPTRRHSSATRLWPRFPVPSER
jgi:catechol 2,3-dioxygenase-like lactoylglutathione lyase family enzyme